jgi:hypothetical protein
LGTVQSVRRPSVALNDQIGSAQSEVDLPSFDDWVKLEVGQVIPLHKATEGSLEHAVSRLAVDRPVIKGRSQGTDAGAPTPAMIGKHLCHSAQTDDPTREQMSKRSVDDIGSHGSDIHQRSKHVRTSDSLLSLRRQSLCIGWSVRHDPVEPELAGPAGQDHIDRRVLVGDRNAVQVER